jgi:hypothetical protein
MRSNGALELVMFGEWRQRSVPRSLVPARTRSLDRAVDRMMHVIDQGTRERP